MTCACLPGILKSALLGQNRSKELGLPQDTFRKNDGVKNPNKYQY